MIRSNSAVRSFLALSLCLGLASTTWAKKPPRPSEAEPAGLAAEPNVYYFGATGGGVWKTTDAGETWAELTGNEGLPDNQWGISGITVSPSNPHNLYTIVEAEDGGKKVLAAAVPAVSIDHE